MTKRRQRYWTVATIAMLALPLHAAGSFPISRQQILTLLRLGTAEPVLTMPRALSRVPEPQLSVTVEDRQGSWLRLRVECLPRSECLPFYVELHFRSAKEAGGLADQLGPVSARSAADRSAPLVRPGLVAHLEVRISERIALQIPVRCLEAGRLGELVRVRDEETRKVYRARVLGDGELRAEL